MLKVCVIGAGNWGKNHIKTYASLGCLGGIIEASPAIQEYRGTHFCKLDV